MKHLDSFEVGHYRGIDGLSLPDLTHANLITGSNGVGKTALLEAVWLFTGRNNSNLLWNANVQRSLDQMVDPVAELTTGEVDLTGIESGVSHRYQVSFERHISNPSRVTMPGTEDLPQLPFVGELRSMLDGINMRGDRAVRQTPAGLVMHTVDRTQERASCIIEGTGWLLDANDEHLARYSELVKRDHKKDLKAAMGLILPKITDVEILTNESGRSYVSALTSSGTRLPLKDLGAGIVRLFRLYLSFFTARNGMVLFDEIENGIHYSVLNTLWDRIRLWMNTWNVQVVATTHSSECIDAAIAAFEKNPQELSIHQLYVDGASGKLRANCFTGELLEGARELDLEVR